MAAETSSVLSTSTPRWSRRVCSPPLPSIRTGLRGGSGMGEVALPGRLDAEVVEAGLLAALAFDQDELERWLGDGEVCIAGPALRRCGVEEPGVEVNGGVEVADAERELDSGHVGLLGAFTVAR